MVGVLALPWGLRYFDRARIAAGRDAILRDWAETPAHDAENTGDILRSLLTQPQPTIARSDRYHNNMIGTLRVARLLWGDRPRWGGSVYDLPAKSLYLDTGQMPTIEGFFGHFDRVARWLADRPDIRFVSKVHDIMPLSDPAFYTPDAASRHRRWLDLLAARGHGAIVSTPTVARLLTEAMATRGRPNFPIHTIRLGINPLFAERPAPPSWRPEETYAIVCGALEHRKNHRILLDAWEILHARHGRRTPWLLIAGSAANAHTDIAARLRASPALSARVRIAMDLPTAQIAQLMAGASVLLMPSLAEGFGLPPLEAMATGTPAIVADIPAMRDACGDFATFLDPRDAMAWANAVDRLTFDPTTAAEARDRIGAYRPTTVADHADAVMSLLRSLA